MSRSLHPARNIGAAAVTAALVLAAAAPGSAASPLAEGSAVGLAITTGGQTNDSGAYRVAHDGTRETSSGQRTPRLTALGGQSLVGVGTLAQDATTQVTADSSSVRACAGLAGDGATFAGVGSSACLEPGDNLTAGSGRFDFSGLRIVESDALNGVDDEAQAAGQPAIDALAPPVADAADSALAELGNPELVLDAGALTGSCSANPTGAVGGANLADARMYLQLPDQRVTVVRFPVDPAPNTKVVTDLDQVLEVFSQAFQTQLREGLGGVLADGAPGVDELVTAINDNVVRDLADQLQPFEENVLDITLNAQSRPRDLAIEVAALDMHVLPGADEQIDADFLATRIGAVSCAVAARAGGPGTPDGPGGPGGPGEVSPPTGPGAPGGPGGGVPGGPVGGPGGPGTSVPTSVAAGLDGRSTDDDGLPVGLAILLALAGGAGVLAYRRRAIIG